MKKYITLIILTLVLNMSVYAINMQDTLNSIENSVFGYDYKNDSDITRVERLEEYMYGQKKSGNIQSRVDALQNDSGISVVEKKLKPEMNNKIETAKNEQKMQNQQRQVLKEDDTVEYAIVDKMEKEVFNQTYKNENIYDRLNRLETKMFNKTSNADLSTRVDKLSEVLNPSHRMPAAETTVITDNFNNNFSQVNEQTMPFHMAALENVILKHEYNGDSNSSRLSRLEQKLFNRTFPNDNDVQRLQRVLVAYEAKKDSYKYENNRRMQNIATMSQIGGILLMILAILL